MGPLTKVGHVLQLTVDQSTTPGEGVLPPKKPSVWFGAAARRERGIANSYIRWLAFRLGLVPKPHALARPVSFGRLWLYGASRTIQPPAAVLYTQWDWSAGFPPKPPWANWSSWPSDAAASFPVSNATAAASRASGLV